MEKTAAQEKDLKIIKQECLKTLLSLYKRAKAGHIGSGLSCLDILIYLYFRQMKGDDQCILSKGHAAASLYTVLAHSGRIPMPLLDTYYQDGTTLAAHPPCGRVLEDIPFGTGSLGHGMSLGAGLALARKLQNKKSRVYCIVSDGDCNAGSTWEAAFFAAHHGLEDFTVIVDNNGLQGFGRCRDVIDMEPLADKWRACNFHVITVEDGHDFGELERALMRKPEAAGKPTCIIAKTTKGKGVSYMEDKMEWHYLPMDDELYQKALKENNLE